MNTDILKELAATRAKVAQLEASIASELASELATLPAMYGFNSVDAFIAAVRNASGTRRGRPGRKPRVAVAAGAKTTAGKRRKRAKITDAMRAEVKKLVEAGKTGNEVAKAVGISLPSVQNIKKALGLVKGK
ncbi:MAG: helix-turn-helix domain-containing protein [Opitutaceae bacterium]|nr:helix-turn-helix domain-containing protein [Opitutaceae bacterium]